MQAVVSELNTPHSYNPPGEQPRTALDLLRDCIHSDEQAAWLEFVSRFQPMLAGAVAKAARRWTTPAPALVDALYGFLKVVASHVVQDHFRSSSCQKRGKGRGEETMETSIGTADPVAPGAHDGDQRILMGQIQECLQSHASGPNCERDFAIFWLYYRQGFTAKEISELPEIGISTKGVESTLLRLTRLLRARLNRTRGRMLAWQRAN